MNELLWSLTGMNQNIKVVAMKHPFTFIDFFSGIGGFRVAAEKSGGVSIGYSEINKDAIETYKMNFKDGELSELGDITEIKNAPSADLLMGGVPCQSWSIAGSKGGFDDPRGALWFDTIKQTKLIKPKAFIYENVKGLADPRNKDNLSLIIDSFREIGYLVDYKVMNTYSFGLPQNRERIYIVGIRSDLCVGNHYPFSFPQPRVKNKDLAFFLEDMESRHITKHKLGVEELFAGRKPLSRNLSQKIDELNDFFILCDTRDGHTTIHSWDLTPTTSKEKKVCMAILKNRRKKEFGPYDGNSMSVDAISKIVGFGCVKEIDSLMKKNILKLNEGSEQGKIDLVNTKNSAGVNGVYRIFMPNAKSFGTLTATGTRDYVATEFLDDVKSTADYRQRFIREIYKKKRFRKLTPKEASLIQGFPKRFKLDPNEGKANKQIGNSVSPVVVSFLIKELLRLKVL